MQSCSVGEKAGVFPKIYPPLMSSAVTDNHIPPLHSVSPPLKWGELQYRALTISSEGTKGLVQ